LVRNLVILGRQGPVEDLPGHLPSKVGDIPLGEGDRGTMENMLSVLACKDPTIKTPNPRNTRDTREEWV